MNVQSTARDPLSCYACHNQTGARCSYCLLPVGPENGEQVQSWFTRRHVPVCTPCQAKLQEIAQEEESLSWAAQTRHRAAVVYDLPRGGGGGVNEGAKKGADATA